MYNSLTYMIIAFLLTVTIILFIAEKEDRPWKMVANFFHNIITNKQFASIILLMLAVLWINKLELSLEKAWTFINWDFTPFIRSYEYGISPFIQRFQNMPTTSVLSYVYVIVFPALVWCSLIYYKNKEDDIAVRRTFFAFILNYLFAIPFYLFVPVNETWYANQQVHLLIANVYPAFNTEFRQLSGLNNDFPSLHNSISWSLAFVARSLGYKRLARLLTVCAILVTLSTIYLGIHWLTDIIGGIILAIVIIKVATRLSELEYDIPQLNIDILKRKISGVKKYLLDMTTNLFS